MVPVGKRTPYRVSPIEPIAAESPRGWWIPDAAFAALRVCVGMLLIRHGLQDHFGILLSGTETCLGPPEALTDRWMAATLEIAGGALLAAGLFARSAAIALLVVVVLGYFAPESARGHWTIDGRELISLYCAVFVAFGVIGAGLFSVDALIGGRPRARRRGTTVSLSPWIKREYRRREMTR